MFVLEILEQLLSLHNSGRRRHRDTELESASISLIPKR